MTTNQKKDSDNIWHPYTHLKSADASIVITRGEGTFLFDEHGKKYIDAVSSWWVNMHGHAHPYIAKKIYEQALELEQVIFAGFSHQQAIELSEKLLNILPKEFSKIFFSDDGSTAVEVAIKMAVQFFFNQNKKPAKILALENAYHGDTFGAMAAGERGLFNAAFNSMLFEVDRIALPNKENINEIKIHLENIFQSGEYAAFIFEPLLLGAAGMLMYEPFFLDEIISICKENNVITIADEVMTGFGRTGKMFAIQYLKNVPDIICLSKGLTGGFLPLSVTVCKQFIYDAFVSENKMHTFFHGHSYTANPLGCAAALASLDLFKNENTFEKINSIHQSHLCFASQIKNHPLVRNCRVLGTVIAFEIGDGNSYLADIRDKLYHSFLQQGILLRPLGNTVYIMPPYCITDEELQSVYNAIILTLNKI
jgi:adenosylmethionine---8-amino-7-oxononanoate aminotransferase